MSSRLSALRAFIVVVAALTIQGRAQTPPAPLPAPAEKDVVTLEKVVVADKSTEAANTFADKAGTDSLTEVIAGKALQNPNAQSASDLFKNTPGVTVSRGADGSTNLSVRGLDSRFVRVTVDGQRQGGGRNPLDSIPPEMVKSLEVTKALTPDLDGDAIGGVINVTTTGVADLKAAYFQGRHQLTFNPLENRPGVRNSLTYARPAAIFSDKNNGGLLATVNYDDQYRVRENFETDGDWPTFISPGPAPFAGVAVPSYTRARDEVTRAHRRRGGAVFNADARFGTLRLSLRSSFNRDDSQRVRQRERFDVAEGAPVELAPDRGVFSGVHLDRRESRQHAVRDAGTVALVAKTTVGRAELDGSAGLVLTREHEPRTIDAVFRSDHTFRATYDLRADPFLPRLAFLDEVTPADSAATQTDPARYQFNNLTITSNDSRDLEGSGRFNVKLPLDESAATPAHLKFGAKLQQRHRTADLERSVYDSSGLPLSMAGLVRTALLTTEVGDYRFGPIPNSTAVAALLATQPAFFQLNALDTRVSRASGDYTATETIWAAYGMGCARRGAWTLLGGVRVEGTRVTTTGSQLSFDTAGALAAITPASAAGSYTTVLPGLHLRYDARATLVWRGSVTRALARPSYGELAPRRQINFIDRRSVSSNPTLKPYEATNFDLSVDSYHERAGVFSAAVFYKKIEHFIVETQAPLTLGSLGTFLDNRRINGGAATVAGWETSWKSITWSLPAEAGEVSSALTYTLLHSEAKIPARPGEKLPLPRQANHQISLTQSYERGRFALEIAGRFRSALLEGVIGPGRDIYKRAGIDLELSAAWKLSKTARITLAASNPFNRPEIAYAGDRTRLKEYENAGPDFSLGFQWKR
ncbi:MAG: TonB-dependent receptor [Undibacterium sp.]|nr:TonB-dependent receptor [Opitutaceae bacterium]